MYQNFRINPNVSLFRHENGFYLFSPLSRSFASMNLSMFKLLNNIDSFGDNEYFPEEAGIDTILKDLIDLKILIPNGSKSEEMSPIIKTESPARLTVFPTTQCNLKCVYCYAKGGDKVKNLEKEAFDILLRWFLKDLKNSTPEKNQYGNHTCFLSIHGGGEPTTNFPLLKYIVASFKENAQKNNLKPVASMVSNGTYNQDVYEWILDNNIGVSFSLDGPEDIQNFQRPYRSGAPSFPKVVENISKLIKAGRNISVRATVTSKSLHSMQETLVLADELGISGVHFEPVSITGRCNSFDIKEPDERLFAESLINCFMLGLKNDIDVSYSGLRCFDHYRNQFCSACGNNICLTPDNNITTCYEVLDAEDPASKIFFIGHIDKAKKEVILFQDKIEFLKSRITENLEKCSECFLKNNCAGDCLAKTFRNSSGDIFQPVRYRCRINEIVNKELIANLADDVFKPRELNRCEIIIHNSKGVSNEKK